MTHTPLEEGCEEDLHKKETRNILTALWITKKSHSRERAKKQEI
jgi:hypothetical protein